MREEAKGLSKLVEKTLPEYNHEILRSSAVVRDMLPDGGGGGGGGPPPQPSGCNWACLMSCVLQSPDTLANCIYAAYVCGIAPGPENPACWALVVCVIAYGILCVLICCYW